MEAKLTVLGGGASAAATSTLSAKDNKLRSDSAIQCKTYDEEKTMHTPGKVIWGRIEFEVTKVGEDQAPLFAEYVPRVRFRKGHPQRRNHVLLMLRHLNFAQSFSVGFRDPG